MTELQYIQKRIRDLCKTLADDNTTGSFRNNQMEALAFYLFQANQLMPPITNQYKIKNSH